MHLLLCFLLQLLIVLSSLPVCVVVVVVVGILRLQLLLYGRIISRVAWSKQPFTECRHTYNVIVHAMASFVTFKL